MFPNLYSCLVVFTQSFCTVCVLKAKMTYEKKEEKGTCPKINDLHLDICVNKA